MTSTERLVHDLEAAGAPAALIQRARANEFHDFLSESATPIHDLVRALSAARLPKLAAQAMNGDYDSTKEEAEAWAASQTGEMAHLIALLREN